MIILSLKMSIRENLKKNSNCFCFYPFLFNFIYAIVYEDKTHFIKKIIVTNL